MTKKVCYLLSFIVMTMFLCLSGVSVNAQVTIGANEDPHPGAVLDLRTEKGLLLSKAALQDASIFQLSSTEIVEGKGMVIYNTNPNMKNGQGEGVYVWDGAKWMPLGSLQSSVTKTKKVEKITITGPDMLYDSESIPFIANVFPEDADNQTVTWTIEGDAATIDATTGEVTGIKAGVVVITATATDGSGVSSTHTITFQTFQTVQHKVTGITISGASSVVAEKTIPFSANVLPSDADNKTVTWSIVSGDAATINATTGVLTGVKTGSVSVKATATDGSGISSNNTITVSVTAPTGAIKAGNYNVYCYSNSVGCWMIENSKENESAAYATTWTGKQKGERGYYYANANVNNTLCPTGYHIPSDSEWSDLVSYITNTATQSQKDDWTTNAALAGAISISSKQAITWGSNGYWWTSNGKVVTTNGTTIFAPVSPSSDVRANSVRCVKKY